MLEEAPAQSTSGDSLQARCRFTVDQRAFLRQFDTVFLRPIAQGYDAFPVGNGDLAAIVWQPDHLTWMLNKCDISGEASQAARLVIETPIPLANRTGRLETRLSLAEATATMRYTGNKAGDDLNELAVQGYIPDGRNVLLIDYCTRAEVPHPVTIRLERWVQPIWGHGLATHVDETHLALSYALPDGTRYAVVLAHEGFTDAVPASGDPGNTWLTIAASTAVAGRLAIAVVTSHEAEDPFAAALALADATLAADAREMRAAHCAAWEHFWGRSFVDAGHPYANALYYMALYELGITSRGRRPVKFNGALNLWTEQERSWGEGYTIHNQHSTYLPAYAANHVDLVENFHEWIAQTRPEAVKAAWKYHGVAGAFYPEYMSHHYRVEAPETRVTEPLEWYHLCYLLSTGVRLSSLLWQRYRYTLDATFLAEKAYPVMRDVAEFYVHYGQLGDDGRYHIAPSMCWEEPPIGRDSHADCAAWRTIFTMAIDAAELLHVDADAVTLWRERLAAAPEYPVQDGIFSVVIRNDGTPEPPEHFQWQLPNLSAVYPYGVIGVDTPEPLREIAERTFIRYRFNADAGHEYLPVIAARLGQAEWWRAALFQFIQFFQNFDQGLFNYYSMSGNKNEDTASDRESLHPYLEGSGIFATAINEMLLQSHGGVIRVFPAVPAHWPARFKLLAEGAFLVASEHRAGEGIPYIAIQAVGGESRACRVAVPWPSGADLTTGEQLPAVQLSGGVVEFPADPDTVYLLTPRGVQPDNIPLVELCTGESYSPSRLGATWYGNKAGANNHTASFPIW